MKSFCLLGLLVIVALAAGFTGCANKSEEKKSGKAETNSTVAQQVSAKSKSTANTRPAGDAQFSLVGVWLGTTYLDEQALNEKLAAIQDEAVRANLLSKAETFYSMWMAAQFNLDQTMELDVEITLSSGDVMKDQAQGSWKAAPGDENTLMVTTVEHRGEQTDTSTKTYLIVDQDHISIVPSVAEELQDLHPFIIFQRQADQQIPLSAQADSAESLK